MMHKVDVHEVFADDRVAEMADAIAGGDTQRIRSLAPATNMDAKGDDDVTLLQWAVLNGSFDGLDALLAAGADPSLLGMDGYTVMHTAALVKEPKYLDLLLQRGISPDLRNGDNQTPIFTAITGRRIEQVHALLAAGASIHTADNAGDTPLHKAALINDFALALELLQAGADPKALNNQKATFQDYLFMGNPDLLNERARKDRDAIEAWLVGHGVTVTRPR